ncbi:MAG: hypothetical protein A3G20_04670 [Acidobacteria bacterium RIFCSPLOWO2_12_FULL_59_11]|nr:MAG: hypothetical protein A3G20_04670 [Acidobacteria bacterium RIFCSPLOWO2_12_FULL_59_11]
MKRLVLVLSVAVLWPLSPSWAQLFPPNEAGVSLGAWHTIVRNVEVTKEWWQIWGGVPMKIDGVEVMKFPGVFVFMVPGEPKAPSLGAMIDHIAFASPDGYGLMKKLVDAGVDTDKINPETLRSPNWRPGSDQRTWSYAYSPDGLRVEIESTDEWHVGKGLAIQSDMIHFYFKDLSDLRASYPWWRKYFAGKPFPSPNISLLINGTRLNFALANQGPRPLNKGGALDYIGFEVKDLEAFCKRLQADGVKFDQPYSKTRHKSYASAQFTDPWGTVIELTEGLNKF